MKEFLEKTIMQWLDKASFNMDETEKREVAIELAEFILNAIDSSDMTIVMTPEEKVNS